MLARIDERGRPVTVVNAEGDRLTPSVVLFDGDETVVGKEALKAIVTEAEHVAECSKRDVGQRAYHKVLEGKQYPPEVIEAFDPQQAPRRRREADRPDQQGGDHRAGLLRRGPPQGHAGFRLHGRLRGARHHQRADRRRGGLRFPARLSRPARQHRRAAKHPGLRPRRRHLRRDRDAHSRHRVQRPGHRRRRAPGRLRLGPAAGRPGGGAVPRTSIGSDPRENPVSASKLWRECEDAKRTLSARQKAAVACDHHGVAARIEISRQQFEEATQDLLDRTRFTTVQALRAAGLDWHELDRVLLVGGSTRMPMVREMLRQLSGKEPDDSVAADEAVAHGAALQASLILAGQAGLPAAFKIRNVNSHSLGVVGTELETKRRRNGILIPRNTPLPATVKGTFKTKKAGQQSIRVDIVEGESPSADDCTPIGRCAVRQLPPNLPALYPVEVLFHYEPNGRLKVRVTVPDTDRQVATEIIRENSLSKEHMDEWRRHICGEPPTAYR